jgi:eukaryotic translation initiation factor 2C
VKLTPTMLQVPHQVLPMPVARYRAQNKEGDITAKSGSHWKFPYDADRFLKAKPRERLRYAIILSPQVKDGELTVYEKRLRDQFEKLNLSPKQCRRISEKDYQPKLSQVTEAEIQAKLDDLTKEGRSLDFVFFLLDRADTTVYRNFKNAADRLYPIQSVCITRKDPKPPRNKPLSDKMISEINTNIMMKVNLKLEGINHRIDGVSKWLKNTMVIGADLVHPGAGAFPGTPSIAAVVGSIDPDGGKCLGSLRLQSIEKTDREVSSSPQ